MSRLATWLPPVAWTAAILSFSSDAFSADNTGSVVRPLLAWLLPWLTPASIDTLHALLRKSAHVTEFAVLAALWLRAFTRSGAVRAEWAAWLTVLIGVTVASADEVHQAFLPSRTSAVSDVMIDTAGVLLAVLPARLGWRRAVDVMTHVLLWVGLAGGAAALAVAYAAGVGGGILWFTVPLAAVALFYSRRARSADKP